jgi:aspartyl/asparaginyl-tRNA synthetase
MNRSLIIDLADKKKVLIAGFLEETRILSKVAFLIIRDVSGKVQCVVKSEIRKILIG